MKLKKLIPVLIGILLLFFTRTVSTELRFYPERVVEQDYPQLYESYYLKEGQVFDFPFARFHLYDSCKCSIYFCPQHCFGGPPKLILYWDTRFLDVSYCDNGVCYSQFFVTEEKRKSVDLIGYSYIKIYDWGAIEPNGQTLYTAIYTFTIEAKRDYIILHCIKIEYPIKKE